MATGASTGMVVVSLLGGLALLVLALRDVRLRLDLSRNEGGGGPSPGA